MKSTTSSTNHILSSKETVRYNRQISLKEINICGQEKLKESAVLVAGCGGLGSVVALYLAAAGIGHIGIIDFDNVSLTNLHRQIIYKMQDIGNPKVVSAKNNLLELNDEISIETFNTKLTKENIKEIANNYDIIVDGVDNKECRNIIDNASLVLKKPYIYAGINEYIGQVSVFNYNGSPSYRDVFSNYEFESGIEVPGILGVLPGIIGILEANEVLKIITGFGEVLASKLLTYDIRTNKQNIYNIV